MQYESITIYEDEFEGIMGKKKNHQHNHVNDGAEKSDTKKYTRKYSKKDLIKVSPLTNTQENVFNGWYNEEVNKNLFLHGSAGTGKTYIASYLALEALLSKETHYKRLIIIRSAVTSREIGHLPGDIQEKAQSYEEPYIDIFGELLGNKNSYTDLKEQGLIHFNTTSFLRGRTFKDSIIIVDEVQNMSYGELSTAITRVGEDSKIIFCGDLRQNDLNKSKYDVTGLNGFISIIKAKPMEEYFNFFEFNHDDIVRSGLVKQFIICSECMLP